MSRPATRLCIVAVSVACLAACVPLLPHTYYRPVAAGGINPQNPCWKTFEDVRFVRGEVEVAVRIVQRERTPAFVEVALQLPGGHHARVERAEVAMVDAAGTRETLRFDGVSPSQMIAGERLPITARLEGTTFYTTPTLIARNYWLYAPIDLATRETFTLALPPIDIDDAPVVLPDIRFTRTTDVQPLAPLQC